ncbi:PQ-loop repeat-containing protein [Mycoplasmopsis primatum]|uniref:PQ-loop repeat-containing protein n=1 Tax=Mycoplasmopsis primatum TaxID=55604 RepID=UPI000496EFF4|nr:PQ-loop repeat-containing protein [Mycoplasmopsis primatum]
MSILAITNLIFGIMSSIIMVAICIPQLISILKSKTVGNVSYSTFLIYFSGGVLFIITMVLKDGVGTYQFDSIKHPNSDPIVNIIGNYLFILIMSSTITSFLIYDKQKSKSFKVSLGLVLWTICLIMTAWISIVYIKPSLRVNWDSASVQMTIITIMATLCTALPFSIQIYKTVKAKSAKGLSIVMLYLGVVVNAALTVYLGTLLPISAPMWWVCVILQLIAIIIYIMQIILYYYYSKKEKLNDIEPKVLTQSA